MKLQDAIEEVKRITPGDKPWTQYDFSDGDYWGENLTDQAIATILNAVVKGELRYGGAS